MKRASIALAVAFAMQFAAGIATAEMSAQEKAGLERAKNRWDTGPRPADAPRVSTGSTVTPDLPKKGPSVHPKEVPSPVETKKYNPTNDKDVQKGWDDHQKKHGK